MVMIGNDSWNTNCVFHCQSFPFSITATLLPIYFHVWDIHGNAYCTCVKKLAYVYDYYRAENVSKTENKTQIYTYVHGARTHVKRERQKDRDISKKKWKYRNIFQHFMPLMTTSEVKFSLSPFIGLCDFLYIDVLRYLPMKAHTCTDSKCTLFESVNWKWHFELL